MKKKTPPNAQIKCREVCCSRYFFVMANLLESFKGNYLSLFALCILCKTDMLLRLLWFSK